MPQASQWRRIYGIFACRRERERRPVDVANSWSQRCWHSKMQDSTVQCRTVIRLQQTAWSGCPLPHHHHPDLLVSKVQVFLRVCKNKNKSGSQLQTTERSASGGFTSRLRRWRRLGAYLQPFCLSLLGSYLTKHVCFCNPYLWTWYTYFRQESALRKAETEQGPNLSWQYFS